MKWIICIFLQHKYKVLRKINSTTRELECIRCGKKYGMNDHEKTIIPLDQELIDAHEIMLGGNL